jgi:hypothetical protein
MYDTRKETEIYLLIYRNELHVSDTAVIRDIYLHFGCVATM